MNDAGRYGYTFVGFGISFILLALHGSESYGDKEFAIIGGVALLIALPLAVWGELKDDG